MRWETKTAVGDMTLKKPLVGKRPQGPRNQQLKKPREKKSTAEEEKAARRLSFVYVTPNQSGQPILNKRPKQKR